MRVYILRVARWAASGLNVSGPRWSSMGEFKDPPQTRSISGIRTRKSVGENQEPKPKPIDPKPADIRLEPDLLPSLLVNTPAHRDIGGGARIRADLHGRRHLRSELVLSRALIRPRHPQANNPAHFSDLLNSVLGGSGSSRAQSNMPLKFTAAPQVSRPTDVNPNASANSSTFSMGGMASTLPKTVGALMGCGGYVVGGCVGVLLPRLLRDTPELVSSYVGCS
jgi:hypothetical protein